MRRVDRFPGTAHRGRRACRTIRAAAGEAKPFLFIASPGDFEACAISLSDAEFFRILDLAPHPPTTVLPAFDALMAKCATDGKPVFLSRGARELLELAAERGAPAAAPLLEHIAARYESEVFDAGFRGERLRAKP